MLKHHQQGQATYWLPTFSRPLHWQVSLGRVNLAFVCLRMTPVTAHPLSQLVGYSGDQAMAGRHAGRPGIEEQEAPSPVCVLGLPLLASLAKQRRLLVTETTCHSRTLQAGANTDVKTCGRRCVSTPTHL